MGCKFNCSNPPILCQFTSRKTTYGIRTLAFSSSDPSLGGPFRDPQNASQGDSPSSTITATETRLPKTNVGTVNFKTLGACKLGISRYPDFEYNAQGGTGTGTATTNVKDGNFDREISVSFDLKTLYIPPLTSGTTKFMGLPLPPLLKIDIVPELFQGSIDQESGQVDLEFIARFLFSVGSIYRAPPLLVKTVLTSEESKGKMRSGRGERMDKEGRCRLVGVATVDPIDDFFMNTFLSLPTECLANLNAVISLS